MKRTRHLKGIVSVPLLLKLKKESASYRCVGVINLDSASEAGAKKLLKNEEKLARYFLEVGPTIAALRL